MPATINGTTGFGGNLTGNVTGNVTGTSSAVADGAVSAAKLDGAQSGSAPIYGCRAWVNFDGTRDASGAASTSNTNRFIRASGNVASVLRNGAGDYTITFTTAMLDANYATAAFAGNNSGNASVIQFGGASTTASAVRVSVVNSSFVGVDRDVSIAIFR